MALTSNQTEVHSDDIIDTFQRNAEEAGGLSVVVLPFRSQKVVFRLFPLESTVHSRTSKLEPVHQDGGDPQLTLDPSL